jgi:hypothetical protein
MHMGMVHQVLTPSVEHHQTADTGSEVPGIGGNFEQCAGGGLEQNAVDHAWILQGQRCQFVRQGEYDVEVRHGQQFALPLLKPGCAGQSLALGAMPVAARVVLNPLLAAGLAALHMSPQLSSPAAQHSPQRLTLLTAEGMTVTGTESGLSVPKHSGDI